MTNGARVSTVFAFCLITVTVNTTANAVQKTFTGNVSSDWFNGDNWNPAGVPAAGDDVVLDSGTLDLSGGNATVATYTHNNGTCTGSGTLTVTGAMAWARADGNSADGPGGAVFSNGPLLIEGSTLVGNSAWSVGEASISASTP